MAMSSARSFSLEGTNRYEDGFFDPARMAQSFAGIIAGGDNNGIVVRGNSLKACNGDWKASRLITSIILVMKGENKWYGAGVIIPY
jgi:hypothetical protein